MHCFIPTNKEFFLNYFIIWLSNETLFYRGIITQLVDSITPNLSHDLFIYFKYKIYYALFFNTFHFTNINH